MSTEPIPRGYSRLNTRMGQYIRSLNAGAGSEDLRYQLRNLITEAIEMKVTLAELLKVLTRAEAEGAESDKFINHVSRQYDDGVDRADARSQRQAAPRKPRIRPRPRGRR